MERVRTMYKPLSDSTLMSMTKKEIIENLRIAEHNFFAAEETLAQQAENMRDWAQVVRCKECKHWKPSGSKAGNSFSDMEYIGGCEFTNYCRRESDFCSYGERKEGAE